MIWGDIVGNIIQVIERETRGKSYKSARYCNDELGLSNIQYEDNDKVIWKNYGETEQYKHSINLKERADAITTGSSIFSYFLDGSRHTYKVDDISYNKNVYPILAGQVGIGCCKRINKVMQKELFERKLIIVLPSIANREGWGAGNYFNDLLGKINVGSKIKEHYGLEFDAVKSYTTDHDEKLDKKGVAVIQDYMVELEKDFVASLVLKDRLDQNNYLIKDGSLEYKHISNKSKNTKNLSDERIANNYRYVIGVSKTFDPTKCKVKSGGTNSDIVAELKPFERTPVYMYQSEIAGNVYFAIWYLRLHDARYSNGVFDGVVKVEKLVFDKKEQEKGIDSELIDHISAHLLNERNPVCYGADDRWANHIYPVYLTESFVKSKYMSNDLFLQLF